MAQLDVPVSAPGLTTTEAPFIEAAHTRGELYIHQPYELYSEANHETYGEPVLGENFKPIIVELLVVFEIPLPLADDPTGIIVFVRPLLLTR